MATFNMRFDSQSGQVATGQLTLIGVDGVERISDLFRYAITLRVEDDAGLSPETQDDLLRNGASIALAGDDHERVVSGVLSDIQMLSTASAIDATFKATLVPRMWSTTQVIRSRVYQDLDVAGIVRLLLTEHGLAESESDEDGDFEIRLNGQYPVSEYVVQYQESDFDFMNRLMEHAGIYYFFQHLPDREFVLVTDDNRNLRANLETDVRYTGRVDQSREHAVHSLSRTVRRQPAAVLLRDYNWRTPRVQLQSEAPADATTGVGMLNRYGDHFKSPSDGDALARVRAEELLARREQYHLTATVPTLAPGERFRLTGHPFSELDQEYILTSMRLAMGTPAGSTADLAYLQDCEAIPASVTYRPPLRTARPRILGLMHGVIDGEVPGTAAPIDELGRYKVVLPFDLVAQTGGNASRWIRLAQPASGAGFGIHFPLHIGVEVAISHVDGDPDRPVIVASPPNTETVTPVQRDNATQSKIRTQTGIRITFDDDVTS